MEALGANRRRFVTKRSNKIQKIKEKRKKREKTKIIFKTFKWDFIERRRKKSDVKW